MKKGLIVIFILFNFQFIGKKAELYAQPSFSLDTTFQPFFDVTGRFGSGQVTRIWENPLNGNLHIAGAFRLFLGNDPYYSLLSTHRDGSRNFNFIGYSRSGMSAFYPINDSVFISGYGGGGELCSNGHRWELCMDQLATKLSKNSELFSCLLALLFSQWVFFNDQ